MQTWTKGNLLIILIIYKINLAFKRNEALNAFFESGNLYHFKVTPPPFEILKSAVFVTDCDPTKRELWLTRTMPSRIKTGD